MALARSHKKQPSLLSRYEKVILVLVKYGFEDVVAHPPFNRFIPKRKKWIPTRRGRSIFSYNRYERVRMVCEELGTTFIKFAQIAANRPDILPDELLAELEVFHDQAPIVAQEKVMAVLEKEYRRPLSDIFESVDETPIASASMSQVHRAVLIGGRQVVLKIQRPGIGATIDQDIQILRRLALVIEQHLPHLASFQPVELVNMFEKSIHEELRFTLEVANMIRFAQNFKGHPDIYVPTVYPEFSTDRVICMEYIEGLKITDLEALEAIGMTGKELALRGINLYFEQVFVHGYFHADPHPGNIFILPDKRVCFIDYGMMGTVVESDKELLADLLLSIHLRDVEAFKRALLRFSWAEEEINERELEYDIKGFFANYPETTLEQIDGEEVIAALNSLFFDYKIKVPPNLLLLLKALVIIEGVGLKLDPTYNIIENIAPFAIDLLKFRFSPELLTSKMIKTAGDWSKLAFSLPDDMKAVIHKLRQGKLHIEFEHRGLEDLYQTMEVVSNRVSFTLLLVALILGSSIIIHAEMPPFISGVSALGVGGFILSGLMALRLAFSILRHGKF